MPSLLKATDPRAFLSATPAQIALINFAGCDDHGEGLTSVVQYILEALDLLHAHTQLPNSLAWKRECRHLLQKCEEAEEGEHFHLGSEADSPSTSKVFKSLARPVESPLPQAANEWSLQVLGWLIASAAAAGTTLHFDVLDAWMTLRRGRASNDPAWREVPISAPTDQKAVEEILRRDLPTRLTGHRATKLSKLTMRALFAHEKYLSIFDKDVGDYLSQRVIPAHTLADSLLGCLARDVELLERQVPQQWRPDTVVEVVVVQRVALAVAEDVFAELGRRLVLALQGLRYFRFGRVLPQGNLPGEASTEGAFVHQQPVKPAHVEELLERVVRGLRRAMHPLTHRRKGAQPLSFNSEYDVQDLLHALLRPWVNDIRPKEFTPSYAGSSTRMDFLLPAHSLVIETKIVRDRGHAKRVGDELIIDIEHYRKHPDCKTLWCVVYDPEHLITNAPGLKNDLDGPRKSRDGEVVVKTLVL